MGRGFAGALLCQAPGEGDRPFTSSPFAHSIPQSRRRASGDLFNASLNPARVTSRSFSVSRCPVVPSHGPSAIIKVKRLSAAQNMTSQSTELNTAPAPQSLGTLSLAALGVVYGDIGTSPLYVMKTVFDPLHGLEVSEGNVIGIISLIFCTLMLVVSLKYITLILRADNHGEGGIMALLSLASSSVAERPRLRNFLFLIGAFGAALFFGDGVITPAISVLSAVEGLEVATPLLKPYVVPIALAVLIALFVIQQRGTGGIGAIFGPVTLIWFTALGTTGLLNIAAAPHILTAFNPLYAKSCYCRSAGMGSRRRAQPSCNMRPYACQ